MLDLTAIQTDTLFGKNRPIFCNISRIYFGTSWAVIKEIRVIAKRTQHYIYQQTIRG